jgi:hypothetical protein
MSQVKIGMFAFPFGPRRVTAFVAAADLASARKFHAEARPLTARELCAAFVTVARVDKVDAGGNYMGRAEAKDFAPEFAISDSLTLN